MKAIRFYMFFIITIGLVTFHQADAGNVTCDCPTISAKGTGNTDCSTSESGGVCTIDYNQFDPADQKTARELVSKALKKNVTLHSFRIFDKTAAQKLGRNTKAFVDQLAIYAMVSVVQNKNAQIDFPQLEQVFKRMRQSSHEISKVFLIGNRDSTYKQDGLLVTNGCIELRVGEKLWAMYKARWSAKAHCPQCNCSP